MEPITVHTNYMDSVFDPKHHRKVVRILRQGQNKDVWDSETDTWNEVKREPIKFDTLVGTGMSGALIVPNLARILKCNWFIVRKPSEKAHSSNIGEGTLGQRWLFVDDLIDMGETFNRVAEAIDDLVKRHKQMQWTYTFRPREDINVEFAGAHLYNSLITYTPEELYEDHHAGRRLYTNPINVAKREKERLARVEAYNARYEQTYTDKALSAKDALTAWQPLTW